MKANWIVCGLYDEAIKPWSMFRRTRQVVVDGRSLGTVCTPWPHLILPLDPEASPSWGLPYALPAAFTIREGPFPLINIKICCFGGWFPFEFQLSNYKERHVGKRVWQLNTVMKSGSWLESIMCQKTRTLSFSRNFQQRYYCHGLFVCCGLFAGMILRLTD